MTDLTEEAKRLTRVDIVFTSVILLVDRSPMDINHKESFKSLCFQPRNIKPSYRAIISARWAELQIEFTVLHRLVSG